MYKFMRLRLGMHVTTNITLDFLMSCWLLSYFIESRYINSNFSLLHLCVSSVAEITLYFIDTFCVE